MMLKGKQQHENQLWLDCCTRAQRESIFVVSRSSKTGSTRRNANRSFGPENFSRFLSSVLNDDSTIFRKGVTCSERIMIRISLCLDLQDIQARIIQCTALSIIAQLQGNLCTEPATKLQTRTKNRWKTGRLDYFQWENTIGTDRMWTCTTTKQQCCHNIKKIVSFEFLDNTCA